MRLSKDVIHVIENVDTIELWHKRLGHMSDKGIMVLFQKNHLFRMTSTRLQKCAYCLVGKQNRVAFKTNPSSLRNENLLNMVHYDLCGPMKIKTLGGLLYFVTCIDDHSRKIWAYTLRYKDQVLDVSKKFQASVEIKIIRKLKCI